MTIDLLVCAEVAKSLFKTEYATRPNVTYMFEIFDVVAIHDQCTRCKYFLRYNGSRDVNGGASYCAKKDVAAVFEPKVQHDD